MEKEVTISLTGQDLKELQLIKDAVKNDQLNSVVIKKAEIDTQPGAVETISILTIVITFLTGLSSQVLGSWIYDKMKKKDPNPTFNVYLNGVPVKTEKEVIAEVEKIVDEPKK